MAGTLNMSNNKTINLPEPTTDKEPTTKSYADSKFLPLAGGTVTGHIILANHVLASQDQPTSSNTGNAFLCKLLIHMYIQHSICPIMR